MTMLQSFIGNLRKLPNNTDAAEILQGKGQRLGQSAHEHQVSGNIQFLGEGFDTVRRKFPFAGLIFDLESGVQFPQDLDIAMDIEIGGWVLMSIEPENKDILAVLVATEIVEGLDHTG